VSSEQNRWRGHPLLAGLLRLAILAVPILLGYVTSVVALRLLAHRIDQTRWWLLVVAAASVIVCFGIERVTRRLLPLAALLKLSMLFPDRAPSRFRVARGAASTRLLNERVTQARTRDAAAVANAVLELITAMTAHDRRTRGHCERVRVFAELLGEQLHLPREARDRLRWAALLHDIGKLHVAPEILNKPAKLNRAEWEIVAEHPAHGEELLGPLIEWLGEWGTAVRQHHEHFDGSGYPDRLAGPEIGRAARIVAIIDSYEVMTAHRAYKKPMATVAARSELARCAGSQFDPSYVRAFLSISLPRLLWAMGPGALLMNLPMLRVLAQATNKGLLAIPQGAVAAASTAIVIGGVVVTAAPSAAAGVPPSAIAGSSAAVGAGGSGHKSVASGHGGSHGGSGEGGGSGPAGTAISPPGGGNGQSSGGGSNSSPSGPSGSDLGDGSSGPGTGGPGSDGSGSDGSGSDGGGDGGSGGAASTSDTSPATSSPTTSGPATSAPPTSAPTTAPPTTTATTSSAAPTTASSAPSMGAPVLVSKPPSSGLLPTVTFTWVEQPGLTYEYKIDGGSWTTLGSTNSLTTLVLIGTHQFRLRARGSSGGPTPETDYTFTVII
jgi:HD domain